MQEKMQEIIDFYGDDFQIIKCIEELSELQKELCKKLIKKEVKEKIKEELADVFVMLSQIMIIFNFDKKEIEKIKETKIKRTLVKLKEE